MDLAGTNWMRPLGSTGLTVSAVTIGGSPLGSMPHLYGHEVSRQDAGELVSAVLDSPFRTLDTSNNYTDGESERRIGAAISARGGLPEDFLVITKVDARDGDYSGERVRESVRESKRNLGLEVLPMVHLHDPEYFDFDEITAPGGAVDALVALRDSGEVGHIGLAGGNVHEMSRYLALGVFEAVLTHNRWTLVDRSATDLIAQAQSLNVAVVNAAVYGGGILANPHGATHYGYGVAPQPVLDAVAMMSAVCAEWSTDLATAALQFSLRDSRFATTVVGISKRSRLDALAVAAAAELPEEFWQQLETVVPTRDHWLDFR